ncbi:lytic transglycosylase domain-containing protein [Streptomyces sp. NPDC003038]|uniref:lytic transglycosylase domain-containing protein n=1 Tax=unclassified Streptomyces TaxID=2593676 RepID=UPI0033B9606E
MAGQLPGRIRKGMRGTAVAAAAMVVLTGSQAPGLAARESGPEDAAASPEQGASGDAHYFRELPPLAADEPEPSSPGTLFTVGRVALPATVFAAYRNAEAALARTTPRCALRWQLLAAIGQVESGQARGGRVDANGRTYAPIVGPQLNGRGFAMIRDTDGGAYDGDRSYDHAVGPMQFIPSTWTRWRADGNGDGRTDPHNVHDAALAAGRYLCAGGRDLSSPADLDRAILSYNHSREYLRVVLSWYAYFRDGHRVIPEREGAGSGTDPAPPGTGRTEPDVPAPRTGTPPASPAPTPPPPSRRPKPAPTPAPSPSADPPPVTAPSAPPGTGIELPGDVLPAGTGKLPGNG